MIDKTKQRLAFFTLGVFYTIYATDSMFFATNINVAAHILRDILLLVAGGGIVYRYYSPKNKCLYGYKNDSLLVSVWIFLTLITTLVNLDPSQRPFVKIIILLISFFLAKQISLCDYARVYCKIMNIIGVVSCIMFLFHDFFRQASFLPTITNTNGFSFRSAIFANIATSTLPVMHRSGGPFWEPGTYQAYLILGIVFSLLPIFSHKERRRSLVIYFLSLIFTYSTTGYMAAIPLIIGYVLSGKRISMKYKLILTMACVFTGFYIFLNEDVFSLLFGKVYDENHSYLSRMYSLKEGLNTAMRNPVFGVGPVQFENILAGVAVVNTTIMHFAIYGIPVGLIYLYCMFRFSKNCANNNVILTLCCFIALITATAGENLTYSFLFNLILFLKPAAEENRNNNLDIACNKKQQID